jgi:multidrug efflux system outer membrane protein
VKQLWPLLLLSGCAGASLLERPAPALPPGYAVPAVPPQSGAGLAALVAADPAYKALLAAAEAGSPTLEVAAARVLQARAGLKAARAAGAPAIDASANVTRNRASLDQFNFDIPAGAFQRERTTLQPAIEARWELDLFGRLAAGRGAAAARLRAATADAAGTRLALENELARNLAAVRTIDARAGAAADAAASARQLDRLARVRAAAGLASGLDTATTAADVAAADAALAPIRAARAARVAALGRLAALPSGQVEALLQPPQSLAAADQWRIPDVPADLLRRRPDIEAAHARLAAADREVAAALAARFPALTLTGSLGWLTTTVAGLFTGDALAANAGATLAGPLLDFGRTAAEVARSRGAAAEAAGLYRDAVLGALAEVETALAEARGARAQAADLGRSADALARARQLAESQYRAGLTDARTVAEAARRLADARDRRLAADGDALDAALRLELATGGGLGEATAPR